MGQKQKISNEVATDTWTTKDGRVLPIKDMSSEHLCNTIHMIKNTGRVRRDILLLFYLTCPKPMGMMAQEAVEQEFENLINTSALDFIPFPEKFHMMKTELESRLCKYYPILGDDPICGAGSDVSGSKKITCTKEYVKTCLWAKVKDKENAG